MELEVARILADWLANKTSPGDGINPLLSSVPLDNGDTSPLPVAVYDFSRDSWVARKMLPNDDSITLPAVAVCLEGAGDVDGEIETAIQDGRIQLAITYLFEKSDTKVGAQNALYTKRAIRQSLNRLHKQDAVPAAARIRNGIHLWFCDGIRLDQTVADWQRSGSAWLSTAVLVNYRVRDLAPWG